MASTNISSELQAEIQQSREAGNALDTTEPRASAAWYSLESERVFMELKNGIVLGFPYQVLQGLESATSEELLEVEVTPSGYGLHWESLDVDLAVPELVAGIFGTKSWMAVLGQKGGQAKSSAKAKASRENGKRGGRPRKAIAESTAQQRRVER